MLYQHPDELDFTLADLPAMPRPERVLMATPVHFEVAYVINPHMEGNVGAVMAAIEGSIIYPLRFRKELQAEGVPFKRSNLLYGVFGTGKTSGSQAAALEALDAGVTVIFADAGADINELLQTGRLYGPSYVHVEDIDTFASSGEDDKVSKFLDAFDGVTAKGGEVMVTMTTNRIEQIHKGFLRPGRVDSAIEIGYLDRQGVEKLVRLTVEPGKLADDVDFDEVYSAVDEFTPAFIAEVLKRAKVHSIGRLGGDANYVLSTNDLVGAAMQLRGHHNLMKRATEGQVKPTLDRVIDDKLLLAAQTGVNGAKLDRGGDTLGELQVDALTN